MSNEIAVFEDKTPRGCGEIHRLIKGYVEVAFERYLDGLQAPQPYQCQKCGQTFLKPEDLS